MEHHAKKVWYKTVDKSLFPVFALNFPKDYQCYKLE